MIEQSTKPGKWMFLLPWSPRAVGGVNQVVCNLHDGLNSGDAYDPMLMISDWRFKTLGSETINGINCMFLRHRAPKPRLKELLVYILLLPFTIWSLAGFIKKQNILVVNPHYPGISAFNYAVLKRLGVGNFKLVLSLHGRDVRDILNMGRFDALIHKFIYRSADYVVACSEGLAEDAEAILTGLKQPVKVVHNGINAEEFRAKVDSGATSSPVDSVYLLNVGTYEHKKGHDVLLKAFAKVAEKESSVRLLIAGRKTDYYDKVFNLREELGLVDRVDLLFDLDHKEVARLLYFAKFFVLPSRNEGFAISLLEAGAMGKAVIAADVCGVAELIDDGVDGLLFQNEDSDTLASLILDLIKDDQKIQKLSSRLNEKVRCKYSWDVAVNKYVDILRES